MDHSRAHVLWGKRAFSFSGVPSHAYNSGRMLFLCAWHCRFVHLKGGESSKHRAGLGGHQDGVGARGGCVCAAATMRPGAGGLSHPQPTLITSCLAFSSSSDTWGHTPFLESFHPDCKGASRPNFLHWVLPTPHTLHGSFLPDSGDWVGSGPPQEAYKALCMAGSLRQGHRYPLEHWQLCGVGHKEPGMVSNPGPLSARVSRLQATEIDSCWPCCSEGRRWELLEEDGLVCRTERKDG